MARLEIEFAIIGQQDVKKGVSDISKAFDLANNEFKKASANTLSLEGDLKSLNKQLAAGTITSEQYAKEQSEITTALASSRQSVQAYQAQLNSLKATLDKGVTSLDNNGVAVKKLAGYHSDFTRGIRGASGVSLEFSRIIQDAPYGIQGIGNNLQQLTSNYQIYAQNLRAAAAEQGKTISSFGIFKSAIGGIFSPLNLLTLGVSLATAGFTAYTNWQQKSAKATRENQSATLSYIETLKGANRSQLEGLQNAQKDLTNLKLLYNAYQNVNLPLKARKEAYEQIQKQYPEYFKNIGFERVASERTKKAYDELTGSIIATSRARAAANLITKNSERQLGNESKIASLEKDSNKLALDAIKLRNKAEGQIGSQRELTLNRAIALDGQRLEIFKQQNDLRTDSRLLSEQNLELEKATNKEMAKGAKLLDTGGKSGSGKGRKIIDRSDAIVGRSDIGAGLAGLEGADKEVEQVRQKYVKLYADLDANAKKSANARKTYESDLLRIQANEATEISQIIIGEKTRVESEIDRINAIAGIKAADNIQKDLALIDKRYADEVIKARGSAEILATIEIAKQTEIEAVYQRYGQKRADAEQKIFDKINEITEKGFTENLKRTTKGGQKIDEQLQDRLQKLRKYFDELRKLNAANPLGQIALGIAENAQIGATTSKANEANNPKTDLDNLFDQDLRNAISRFGDDFVNTLKNINREADETFGSVLGRLGKSLWDSLGEATSDIFINQFKQQFSDAIKSASSKLSTELKGAIAVSGLLGGAISGLTKKTSGVGQGIGGALTGAATGAGAAIGIGAALGSAAGPLGIGIGAAVGGLVGLFKGIFGAKKARKEEAIQAAQLAEQQKQTKLLEIQNALAYASSIIGQQTNQGIVTGIERDATGNLVAKVAGKDMLLILERAQQDKKRGIL